jgi:hypothetical protein
LQHTRPPKRDFPHTAPATQSPSPPQASPSGVPDELEALLATDEEAELAVLELAELEAVELAELELPPIPPLPPPDDVEEVEVEVELEVEVEVVVDVEVEVDVVELEEEEAVLPPAPLVPWRSPMPRMALQPQAESAVAPRSRIVAGFKTNLPKTSYLGRRVG